MAGAEISHRQAAKRLLARLAALTLLTAAGVTAAADRVFTYALEGAPESLDFAKTSTERAIRVAWLLCDALVNVSKDGQSLEPGLAESWKSSADGLSVVMKLRAGVRFHDGSALDAEAVKASLERQFRPSHPLYTAEPKNVQEQVLAELIDDIRVIDRLTFSLKLKYPGLHYLSQSEIVSPTAVRQARQGFRPQPGLQRPFQVRELDGRADRARRQRSILGRAAADRPGRVPFHRGWQSGGGSAAQRRS